MNEHDRRICEIWDDLGFQLDKSTSWMMAMCADRYLELYDEEIDDRDIATALYQQSLEQEAANDQ